MGLLWDSVHAAECHPCPGVSCSLCDDDSPAVPHQAFVGMFRQVKEDV